LAVKWENGNEAEAAASSLGECGFDICYGHCGGLLGSPRHSARVEIELMLPNGSGDRIDHVGGCHARLICRALGLGDKLD
jgi:hypothetical protein